MSLLPVIFDDIYSAPSHRRRELPRRGLWEDILQPLRVVNSLLESPEYLREFRNLEQDVILDKNKFQANFDIQHFKPEEICVKVTGDHTVTVEAKHEEKQDEHGQIYRHFVRKYVLPKNCDMNRLESKLSSDGVLTISAPTVGDQIEHKSIPITQTGKPARSIQEKKVEPKKSKI